MGKVIILCMMFYFEMYAGETSYEVEQLQSNCLKCHMQEQIPTQLIYRRYLMTYSTQEEMQNAIFKYMKDPQKKNSIMPPPFFYKFPMKEVLDMDDKSLKQNIRIFLDYLDVKKKLILP
ncbi:hypothetical protein [Sulfurovum sp.]|uniref:hypothetical protein n=1 Tax=Sulfurovum sp. TaxID=1969726 RepID=UPI002867E21F|nr:hypothetical protein [Sulfurovum sp.]